MGIDKDSHIRFGWMTAWSSVVDNVPLSILFAYFFPLVVGIIAFFRKKHEINEHTKEYAKICLSYGVISFLYMAFLYQENHVSDANFRNGWVLTFNFVYILAVSILIQWIRNDGTNESFLHIRETGIILFCRKHWSTVLPVMALCIHVLFGLALLVKNYLV